MVSFTTDQPFGGMSREMSKMIDQLQRGYFGFSSAETWQPPVNLYENDTAYLVCVDLAGVDKDRIDIEVHEQRLTLRGTRPVPTFDPEPQQSSERKLRVHLMEIDHGAFIRQVETPADVQEQRISATYRSGMLWIELPKK